MTPRRLLDLWGISDASFDVLVGNLRIPVMRPPEAERAPMLGDRFVARPDFVETCHAVSMAPPDVLWAWLVQTMRGGGIYGWQRLDAAQSRSSRALIKDTAPPAVGDRVDDMLEVCAIDHGVEIVWKSISPLSFLESSIAELSLDYKVERMRPVGARLIARVRCSIEASSQPIAKHAAETIAYILPRCQVSTIAEYATSQFERCLLPLETAQNRSRFQHASFVPAENGHERQATRA